jgi:inner membrane protein
MFIAHLPAGFLLTSALTRGKHGGSRALLALGLAGSVFPDVDLLRNFLIDERRVHHHRYWTHLPAWWLAITIVVLLAHAWRRDPRLRAIAVVFLPNVWLHLVLDTWVGHIAWAWPVDDRFFAFVEVPRRYAWYVWSFVFHWTFLLEVLIAGVAAVALAARRCSNSNGSSPFYVARMSPSGDFQPKSPES